MLAEAEYYGRMALGAWQLVRTPQAPDAVEQIRRQLENRGEILLETLRKVVFQNPRNPYHRMFALAGCEFGDLAESARRQGLEPTLERLLREGVYLTHDEFKGKAPIERAGEHIPSDHRSFVNPLVSGMTVGTSSGSRSKGTRTRRSIRFRLYRKGRRALRAREFNTAGAARIHVKPILPSTMDLNGCLRGRSLGSRCTAGSPWRTPPQTTTGRSPGHS